MYLLSSVHLRHLFCSSGFPRSVIARYETAKCPAIASAEPARGQSRSEDRRSSYRRGRRFQEVGRTYGSESGRQASEVGILVRSGGKEGK